MKGKLMWPLLGILLASFLVGACGPVRAGLPTPQPTPGHPTASRTPTAVPSAVLTPTPQATAIPSLTPTSAATTAPSVTATSPIAPSATPSPVPTSTPVPPTQTAQPTAVPPTLIPSPTPVPPPVITDWMGEYFASTSLKAPAQVIRNDRVVDFTLAPGTASATGMPSENWSARWSRTWSFDEGSYRFHVLVDDGARLWVNGDLLIDAWQDGPERELTGDLYLKGNAAIRLEYYNHLGSARIRLNWERISQYPNWLGSYFAVADLSGLPLFQRGDQAIQFDWGTGSPRADLPADNFSVRWTRRVAFPVDGSYRFRVISDDGVRLWVDGSLLIDSWRDGTWTLEKDVTLTAGDHDVRLDYYEHLGGARVQLSWETASATPTPTGSATLTPTATPTPTPTHTPTLTPTSTSTPATETASPGPTDTAVPPPTDTAVPPTGTPVPLQPQLELEPSAGPIGARFDAVGSGWPPNLPIDLLLIRPVAKQGPGELVAQVNSDAAGKFTVQLTIPPDEGWEGLPSASVRSESSDGRYWAEAVYKLLPQLTKVKSHTIPSDQPRFALPEPAYLVFDSKAAWAEQFGDEPPPADPPVDWARDIVIGAFLGPQDPSLQVEVTGVVQRGETVSVWLSAVVPSEPTVPLQSTENIPRALAWVLRSALSSNDSAKPSRELVFVFLDASGRVLAQGPSGAVEPVPAVTTPQVGAMQTIPGTSIAAAPEATAVAGAATPTEVTKAPQAVGVTPATQVVAVAGEPLEAARIPGEAGARPSGVWWVVAGAGFLLVGWGIGVAVNRRVTRRR